MAVITETRLSCDLSDCLYMSPQISGEDSRGVPASWIVVMFEYANTLIDPDCTVMREHHFCSVAHLKSFVARNTDITPDPDNLLPAHWDIK